MQFSLLYAVASLLATAIAQSSGSGPNAFKNPGNGGYQLTAGKPTTISWTPSTSGTVTLTLRSGASNNLDKGVVLASSIPNSGSTTITPPANTVRNSDYTIEISSDSDPSAVNYTPQLVVESSNTVESASASGSASSAATSAASATSASASSASAASASSASASASASESASSASSASGSKTASASASKTTSSASSSATSSRSSQSSTASAESAPTSGASPLNRFNVQGGLAAAALGAVALL